MELIEKNIKDYKKLKNDMVEAIKVHKTDLFVI
jgi:hypothetical protein